MGISRDKWHKRRATGGKRKQIRMKRKFELGRQPAHTKIGERRVHKVRGHGGCIKFRALKLDHGNYAWPGEAVTRVTRIIDVVYNPSNDEFVRTNTLTKGAIVQIDATPFKNWYQKHYGVCVGKPVVFVRERKIKKNDVEGQKKEKKRLERLERRKAEKKAAEKEALKKGAEKKDKKKHKKGEKGAEKKAVAGKKGTAAVKVAEKKPAVKKVVAEKKPKRVVAAVTEKPVSEGTEKKKERKKLPKKQKHHPSGMMLKKWRLRNASRVLEAAISEQFEKGRLYARVSTRPGQGGSADGYILEGEELAFYVKKINQKKKK
jgi:small subunit ribosomal protein S8e